jgi:hypothetical protein
MFIVATASVILTLLYLNWFLKKKIQLTSDNGKTTESSPIPKSESIYMYIAGTLLNQGIYTCFLNMIYWTKNYVGYNVFKKTVIIRIPIQCLGGYISSKLTPIRLVVGAWCLLTLVLLNVYNGILISYVTATRQARPLINSVDDVLYDPNILLVLTKGLGADVVFSVNDK